MTDAIQGFDLVKGKCYSQGGTYLGKFLSEELRGAVHDPDPIHTFEHDVRGGASAKYTEVDCKTRRPVLEAVTVAVPPIASARPICYKTFYGAYLGPLINKQEGLIIINHVVQTIPVFQHENGILVGNEWTQHAWNGQQYVPAVTPVECPNRGGKQKKRRQTRRKH